MRSPLIKFCHNHVHRDLITSSDNEIFGQVHNRVQRLPTFTNCSRLLWRHRCITKRGEHIFNASYDFGAGYAISGFRRRTELQNAIAYFTAIEEAFSTAYLVRDTGIGEDLFKGG